MKFRSPVGQSAQKAIGLQYMAQTGRIALFLMLAIFVMQRAAMAQNKLQPVLQNVTIDEKLGDSIPMNLTFTGEDGKPVAMSSFFSHGKPVVLTLVYYDCPMLCTQVLNNLTQSLKALPWTAGKEFEILTISINPRETAELAKAKKATYLRELGRPEAAAGWHFCVGQETQIKALADAVGYHYTYDPVSKQYYHATGIFVLTPGGKISRVLYGINYPVKDLRLALTEASSGKVGSMVDKILLFCCDYNPKKQGYTIVAFRVIQVAGTATVIILVFIISSFLLWERRQRAKGVAVAAVPSALAPEGGEHHASTQSANRTDAQKDKNS